MYTKDTDKNSLLKRNSFHVPQTFRGIPRGQFMRARRICSTDQEYEKKNYIINKFEEKGYNRKELEKVGAEIGNLTIKAARTIKKKPKCEE